VGRLPMALALYLNPHGISLFPLFPWTFFVLAGCCPSHGFLNSVETGRRSRYMRVFFLAGMLMIAGSLAARSVSFTLPGRQSFYTTSPLYVLIRVGCVLILCALLHFLEQWGRWIPRRVQLAGQESLMVYGVHLWVIFAFLRGKHVGSILGLETGYAGCLVLSAAIIVFMLWLAKHWHNLKRTHPRFAKLAQAATVVAIALVFLSR
jgi:fucose 4-O-acetylase-like acetyltransferase